MAKKKVDRHGITFDSKLEADVYDVFLYADNCVITDDHKTFEIYPVLDYYNIAKCKPRRLRRMDYTPDIIIEVDGIDLPIAVEVKGFARPEYMMRKKLFIHKYHKEYYFIELKSTKEALEFIIKLDTVKDD